MNFEESYRYHTLCARATLYPGKSIEEVQEIIEKNIEDMRLNAVYDVDTEYRENRDKFLIKKQIQDMETDFRKELENLVNKYSRENGSDTPDFILARYLENALNNFDAAVREREEWYGRATHLEELDLGVQQPVTPQQRIPFPTEEPLPLCDHEEEFNRLYDEECDREANMEELRMEGYLLREDDYPESKKKNTDSQHLQWIHDRMVNMHEENPDVDYLIRLRQIIKKLK